MAQNKISTSRESQAQGFDGFSFFLILSLGLILPIFFIPFFGLSASLSKIILFSVFVVVAFFLWLISRLRDGKLIFPRSAILGSGAIIVLSFLLSSIFSSAPLVSFVGLVGEVGTLSSIVLLFLLMFLSSIYFQDQNRVFYLYFALLISSSVAFICQLLRFIFESFNVSIAGLLSYTPQVMLERWADTAIFFGMIAVLSLVTLDVVDLNKKVRVILYSAISVSLLVLFVVNMSLVWATVGFFALVIFVYSISFGKSRKSHNSGIGKLPVVPLAVLLISLFFVLANSSLSNSIYSILNIPQDVLRPSFSETFSVAKSTLSENLILGAGPNRFVNEWLLYKPEAINNSFAWNLDFNTGIGLIPSFIVTTGSLGFLAWLIFLGAFLYSGAKAMFIARIEDSDRYVIVSSFISALYLWIFAIFYIPNITIIFLAFLMTGVFTASLTQAKVIKNYNFSFLEDPRVGFVSVLVLILLVMSSVAGGFMLSQKFLSVGYFQKSISAFNTEGNIDKSEEYINSAIRLSKNDLYYRTLSEINLVQINSALTKSDGSNTNPQLISRSAIKNAITATEINETNYVNWLFLARVYQSLLPLSFVDKNVLYQSSKESYEKSLLFNPNSPRIELLQARLELLTGNKESAKEFIVKALNKKTNYTEAIFLLSQIQADDGDIDEAIVSAEAASFVSPNDIGVFFHLGLLKYRNKDYAGSIVALERAVAINTNYSNAKYFLGLSYDKEGYKKKALAQFEDIKVLNPDNTEVDKILENLKSGRGALSEVPSPVESEELPVEEE